MATNLRQIEEMFHRAMDVSPDERSGYLDEVCEKDDDLRREVNSLIAAYESGSVLDGTAVTLAMKVLGSEPESSMAGQEVGPYKILSKLGQGGMGAVYLAENRRVNKKVALKFLSSDYIADNWAKRQLIKEAQSVAMLDHPNICAVYDFEEIGEHSFIVMQYIEGQTLSDLIRKKSLKTGQMVILAQQIANALANAHAHGIIHRDVKTKNIMVTPAEQVKVLDFGLAKTIQKNLEEGTESISQLSRDGLLVGTIAYMSPEQLRGEKLDYRTDIFSLGTVLYEMVCGKNPFAHRPDAKSKSNAEVISSIMGDEPPSLRQMTINCPKDFDHVVNRCLRKDPADRYQSAAELLIDLENLQKGLAPPSRVSSYLNVRLAAVAALLLLALFVGTSIYRAWAGTNHTLAVLPIVCEDAELGSPCIGPALTWNLVKTLGRRRGLRVTSAPVAPSMYGPEAASPEKMGRDLNADTVLFGRVRRGEHGLILTTRLQNVKTGVRIAEENYPIDPERLQLLQQQLSIDTAIQLQLPITEDDKSMIAMMAAQQNRSAEAMELYYKGRYYWSKRDGENANIQQAIDNFRAATEKDPLLARAWAGLADCYAVTNTVAFGSLASKDAMNKAEYAARQAIQIDDNLADAHTAYAAVLMKARWDWENAGKEFKRAIAISPDYAPAHWGYSNLLATTGRFPEALIESELAMNLDPFSGPAIMNHCRVQYFARNFDQANACLEKLTSEQPGYLNGKYMHGIALLAVGRTQEAIQIFQDIYAKDKAYGGAMLGFSYGIANQRVEAERVLNEMQELQKQRYMPEPNQEFGIIYLGMNDLDHAFPLLRKSVEDKFPPAQSIFIAAMFDRLRADPRYAELAREVRLPSQPPAASAGANVSTK